MIEKNLPIQRVKFSINKINYIYIYIYTTRVEFQIAGSLS